MQHAWDGSAYLAVKLAKIGAVPLQETRQRRRNRVSLSAIAPIAASPNWPSRARRSKINWASVRTVPKDDRPSRGGEPDRNDDQGNGCQQLDQFRLHRNNKKPDRTPVRRAFASPGGLDTSARENRLTPPVQPAIGSGVPIRIGKLGHGARGQVRRHRDKRLDSPTLKLTRSWIDPHTTSPCVSEFRAHAFQAAVAKALELGWIV